MKVVVVAVGGTTCTLAHLDGGVYLVLSSMPQIVTGTVVYSTGANAVQEQAQTHAVLLLCGSRFEVRTCILHLRGLRSRMGF